MDIKQLLGNTDIYIIDQILKNRYKKNDKVLDAGCGSGRNLQWFYQQEIEIHGIDTDAQRIHKTQSLYPKQADHFRVGTIDNLPYADNTFDHIICSAVLHFATNEAHFEAMITELKRVLKPNGSLFIRMASNFAIDQQAFRLISDGVYLLNDGTNRFLLTSTLLALLQDKYGFELQEKLKTTNVDNLRCMTTLILENV